MKFLERIKKRPIAAAWLAWCAFASGAGIYYAVTDSPAGVIITLLWACFAVPAAIRLRRAS